MPPKQSVPPPPAVQTPSEPIAALPFRYTFSVEGNLNEVGEMRNSSSPYWWISSGGFLELKDGTGRTIQGSLDLGEKSQLDYEEANSVDTDGGIRPQNIFRMVSRSKWGDISQVMYYKIEKINLSTSPNRKASNGIQQMSRYADQDDLYYTALRVDGKAVIK
jgi:hypothetical protein